MKQPARARIFRRPKAATQSGHARMHEWVLEFGPSEPSYHDPLMGWTGSGDTRSQVRLVFRTQEEAVAYASRQGLTYDVERPAPRIFRPRAYDENFRSLRAQNWTH